MAEELGRLGGGGGEGEGLLGTEEGGAGGVGGAEISLRDVDQIKLGCISRLCALGQTFAYAGRANPKPNPNPNPNPHPHPDPNPNQVRGS